MKQWAWPLSGHSGSAFQEQGALGQGMCFNPGKFQACVIAEALRWWPSGHSLLWKVQTP